MILLYVLVVALSTTLGCLISSKLKSKYLYFKEVVDLLDGYKANLTYLQKSMREFIECEVKKTKELRQTLNSFLKCRFSGGGEIEFPFYIKEEEKIELNKLFYSLGTLDAPSELDRTEKSRISINRELEKNRELYEKYGMASIKIALLVGLMIVILLL